MAESSTTGEIRDQAFWEGIMEELGGPRVMAERMRAFNRVVKRMNDERATLMETYPDKWVAMSEDGVVGVADDLKGVLADVDGKGIDRTEVFTEFLDTDPPELIL